MRSKLWFLAVPVVLFGLAACDDQTASNNESATPPTAGTGAAPSTAPPTASGSTGTTTPAPSGTAQ